MPSDIPANMANTSAGRASESQEKKEENTRGWSQPSITGVSESVSHVTIYGHMYIPGPGHARAAAVRVP